MTYRWWQNGIVYQVYPRSFQDSNGDGIGDLRGIIQRLDHLVWLAVDAVWLSPVFPSPMADFGYDVSDYTGIHPMFGTLEDAERLIEEAHGRGLKVIFDFVPNHTSSEHPWFKEARSSRDNPKRDWYVWRDPAPDGGPPTNWLSHFGGSAWTLDEASGQYYYHAFLAEQPDLNWWHPDVRRAMHDALRFWLDRGIDGFRVDVIWHLIHDPEFRDNPPNPDWDESMSAYNSLIPLYTADRPEVHDVIAEMRRVVDEYDDRVLIGEIYLPIERLVTYYGQDLAGTHLPFNFQLILSNWDAGTVAALIDEYEAALPEGGWPNWVLGNHDKSRIATRIGIGQARVAAMLLLTLRGTPTLYYGDEIGMTDVQIPPDRLQDPVEKRIPGRGQGRDPERTPMQWDAGPNAGFTTGEPWLPIADNFKTVNVEAEENDPTSILTLHRRLIELRRAEPALSTGDYHEVRSDRGVLAYTRGAGERRFLIALNLSDEAHRLSLSASGTIRLTTALAREGERVERHLDLAADEGVVVEL